MADRAAREKLACLDCEEGDEHDQYTVLRAEEACWRVLCSNPAPTASEAVFRDRHSILGREGHLEKCARATRAAR